MKNLTKLTGAASAVLLASAATASAAFIDFTDNDTGFSGVAGGVAWELTGSPIAPNTEESGRSRGIGEIAWENDGVGIDNDEVTAPDQFLTLTFESEVRLIGAFFLDLFIAVDGETLETALITVGDTPGAVDASATSSVVFPTFGGYHEERGLSLVGTSFTFFADPGNDDIGEADFALAAVELAAVPLPAGMLLMGTALGGLGLARRRKQRNAS